MALPVALAVAGLGMQAAGMIQGANAAQEAARRQAEGQEANAFLVLAQSVDDERSIRIAAQKAIGRARAQYGAAGVSLEGSPMDVLAESAANAEQDALRVRSMGRMQAAAYRRGASLYAAQGAAAQTSAKYGAAAALLSTGYSIASKFSGDSTYSGGSGGIGAGGAGNSPSPFG